MPDFESETDELFICEVCKLKFKATIWRKEKEERQICKNGHSAIKMRLYKNITEYLLEKFPLSKSEARKWEEL